MLSRHGFRLAVLALAILVATIFAPSTHDDGYITYRFAANLAHGRGFAFNPGESVLGTSAPGYALLLALVAALGSPLGIGVEAAGAAASLAALVALALAFSALRLGTPGQRREPPDLACWIFALLLFASRWIVEMLGSETVAATALIAWAFVLASRQRSPAFAGGLAGLAATFRADAALAVGALAVVFWLRERRLPWRFLVAALALPAACAGWLLATFGSVLPNTLAGKRSELSFTTGSYLTAEWDWLARSFSTPGAWLMVLIALFGLREIGRARGRGRGLLLAAVGWISAHELFYHLVGVPFSPWYQIATFVCLLALVAIGAPALQHRLLRGRLFAALPPVARPVAFAIPLLLLLPASSSTVRFWRDHWAVPPDPRLRVHRDAALELARISPPAASVAAVEIGALAYFSDRRVVDLVGLVNPAILAARREGRVGEVLRLDPPDYLLDNPNFHDSFLAFFLADEELYGFYREVARFHRPEYPFELRLLAREPGRKSGSDRMRRSG